MESGSESLQQSVNNIKQDVANMYTAAEVFIHSNFECLMIAMLLVIIMLVLYFGVWAPGEGFCGAFDSLCMCGGNELK